MNVLNLSVFPGILVGFLLNTSTSGFICTIPEHNGWPFIMYIFSEYDVALAAAVAQWFRAFAPQAKGCEFETKQRKASLPNALNASVTGVLGDEHYKQMPPVTVGMAR